MEFYHPLFHNTSVAGFSLVTAENGDLRFTFCGEICNHKVNWYWKISPPKVEYKQVGSIFF